MKPKTDNQNFVDIITFERLYHSRVISRNFT